MQWQLIKDWHSEHDDIQIMLNISNGPSPCLISAKSAYPINLTKLEKAFYDGEVND